MKRINQEKKSWPIVFLGLLLLISLFASRVLRGDFFEEEEDEVEENIVIAGCPTFYYMLEKLEKEGFGVAMTASTKDNFELMKRGEADFAISGRGLIESERFYPSLLIGPGYVLLFEEEVVVQKEELEGVNFFTDLSKEDVLRDFSFILENNLYEVDVVEPYFSKGIVITSHVNENKGRLVHLINEKGERVRISRIPRLYYNEGAEDAVIEEIKRVVSEW